MNPDEISGLIIRPYQLMCVVCGQSSGFGDGIARSPEWNGCGMNGNEAYVNGRTMGLEIPGLDVEA